MTLFFRWKEQRTNATIAKVSIDFWVQRHDLVLAAIRKIDRSIPPQDHYGDVAIAEVSKAAADLTRGTIERQLRDDLQDRGQTWFEFGISDSLYCSGSDWFDAYTEAAEAVIDRLWPGLSE